MMPTVIAINSRINAVITGNSWTVGVVSKSEVDTGLGEIEEVGVCELVGAAVEPAVVGVLLAATDGDSEDGVDGVAEGEGTGDNVFGVNSNLMRRNYSKQRKPLAAKLKNPRMLQITFHTFRHWKATMEYHKTRDILHVKEILGHRSLDNTMKYTQIISFKDDEYSVRIAHTEEEACQLLETGYDYVCDYETNKLFRKRK